VVSAQHFLCKTSIAVNWRKSLLARTFWLRATLVLANRLETCGPAHSSSARVNVGMLGVLLCLCMPPGLVAAPIAYELNQDHTDVTFQINHAGFSMKHGSFAKMSGTLNLDSEHLDASSVDVSVAVPSIATNHEKRDQDLQRDTWLDAAKYPVMHFVSTKVVQTGPNKLEVSGVLSLHGVTKPLVLHTTINRIGPSPFGNVETAGFSATATLKRSGFGINAFIPMIGDDVVIEIAAEFVASNSIKK
jgi:polyisoprenoid-binding protein YceI